MAHVMKISKIPLSSWMARNGKVAPVHVFREPKPFRVIEPSHGRAIVIPWLSTGEQWEELRYTLRAIDRFWTDKECPILIIGDKAPDFLKEGERVQFIHIKEYEQSNQAGLWEAWQIGMQIAEEVGWWNDDIYLLRECGWDDLRTALEEGDLTDDDTILRASTNTWQQALGESIADLKLRGLTKIRKFATHTPYLFEREKSLEIFRIYHLHHKGSWVNLYHNHHQTPSAPCSPYKAMSLPAKGQERFYNHKHLGPDDKSKKILGEMFPTKAPWEK